VEEATVNEDPRVVVAAAALAAALVAGVLAALGGPLAASIVVDLSILGYAVFAGNRLLRLVPLAAMAGAHIAAMATYYSNPLPLPPVAVVERDPAATLSAVNLDIVGLVVAYDVIDRVRLRWRRSSTEETLNRVGSEETGDSGPGEPR